MIVTLDGKLNLPPLEDVVAERLLAWLSAATDMTPMTLADLEALPLPKGKGKGKKK